MAWRYGDGMQTPAAILSSILALAPATSPPTFDVSDAETDYGERSLHLATFDADGDQSAEIVVWADTDNRVHVDADFADGLYLSAMVSSDGEMLSIESDDPGEAIQRMEAIDDFLSVGQPQESEVMCMAGVIATAGCVSGAILACMGGGLLIACNCLPLIGDTPPGCD